MSNFHYDVYIDPEFSWQDRKDIEKGFRAWEMMTADGGDCGENPISFSFVSEPTIGGAEVIKTDRTTIKKLFTDNEVVGLTDYANRKIWISIEGIDKITYEDRDKMLIGVASHEAGHLMLLSHSDDKHSIMYPTINPDIVYMPTKKDADILLNSKWCGYGQE